MYRPCRVSSYEGASGRAVQTAAGMPCGLSSSRPVSTTAFLERRQHHARRPGPETATVALDVRPYSELQRQALLAHRTQIPRESFLVSLPADLRRRAFATAYFFRLSPP